jgi:hypothetical protein
LFLRNRKRTPLESLSAAARDRCITLEKSTCTSPISIPCSLAAPRIDSIVSAELSSALDGMQPQFRHTPPGWSRSITATRILSWLARMAAT